MRRPDAARPPGVPPAGGFPQAPGGSGRSGRSGRSRSRARRAGSFLAELPVLILIAFVLALLMKTFLVQAFFIPSSSMEPTLQVNDRVLVNKLTQHFREPRRGEVVVFSEESVEEVGGNPVSRFLGSLASGLGLAPPSEKDFIKRVIGLPGETIAMRDGIVYVDDRPLSEAPANEGGYLSARHYTDFGPVTLGPDEYFMMGDNRPSSADSRAFGPIPEDQIVGRAFVVIWPLDRFRALPIAGYGDLDSSRAPAAAADAGPRAAPAATGSGRAAAGPLALAA